MRKIFILFFKNPYNFLKLRHKISLIVQSTGSINKKNINALCFSFFICFKSHGSSIITKALGKKLASRTVCPFFQLFNGCGSKGISGSHHYRFPLLVMQMISKLTYSSCFSNSVNTAHHNNKRL